MFIVGAIQAVLFLGGWNSPLGGFDPIYALIGYEPQMAALAYYNGSMATETAAGGPAALAKAMGLHSIAGLVVLNLYGVFWFVAKTMTVVWVQMWLRWTLPRIRIDQVLYTCVKVLLPFSIVTLVGAAVWIWLVPQPAAHVIGTESLHRLGHLTESTPLLQLATQWILTVIGVGFVLSFVGTMALGWAGVILRDPRQPQKSLFADIMPVGREIPFNPGKPAEK